VAPDLSSALSTAPQTSTHLVDGITNVLRLGDIPNKEGHISNRQPSSLGSQNTDVRVEMSLDDVKDSDLSLSSL